MLWGRWPQATSRCARSARQQPSSVGSDRTREPMTTPQSPPSGNTPASNTSHPTTFRMRCKMPSQQSGRTHSTLPRTRSAHTSSARVQQWPCSLVVALFSSSWWSDAGQAMHSYGTSGNKSKNSITMFLKNANPHVPQAYSKLFIPNSFPPRS